MSCQELKTPFVVTVSGDAVAGKSSAVKALMTKYEQDGFYCTENIRDNFSTHKKVVVKVAAGQLFRILSGYSGRSIDELRTLAKKHYKIRSLVGTATNRDFFSKLKDEDLDKTIDAFIDEYVITAIHNLIKKCEKCEEAIIIADSRIAGLLMNIRNEPCMKVRFSIQFDIAAKRLVEDSMNRPGEIDLPPDRNEALKVAFESVKNRSNEDRARFIATYSKNPQDQDENKKVDIQNLNNYDLIINTSGTTIENEIKVFHSCLELARNNIKYHRTWRSTKYIYPGSLITNVSGKDNAPMVKAIKIGTQYYALSGQEYVGVGNHKGYKIEQESNNESGYPLIPVETVAQNDEFIFAPGFKIDLGETAEHYIQNNITEEFVRSFEQKYDFKYPRDEMAPLKSGVRSTKSSRNSGMIR